jgi:hypothetical protein
VSELSGSFGGTWAHKPAFVQAFGLGGSNHDQVERTLEVVSAALDEVSRKATRAPSEEGIPKANIPPIVAHEGIEPETAKEIDLDPTGATLAWWRQRMDDAIRISIYVMGGIAAVAGIALSALLSGDLTPAQVYYADTVLTLSTMLVFASGYGVAILYFFKIADVVNVFSPNRSQETRKVQIRKAMSSVGLWCFVIMGLGVTLGLPTYMGLELRRALPEFHRLLRCEVEVLKSFELPAFVPEFDCTDTLLEMRSTLRMPARTRTAPDNYGE